MKLILTRAIASDAEHANSGCHSGMSAADYLGNI
jgi:hypothetical protein